jgi:ureidoacrylate peracid hydrolase
MGWDCSLNAAAASRLAPFLAAARQAGVPIVWIQAIYDDLYLSPPMIERNIRRGIDSPRCQTGTWGADFYHVRPQAGEPVVIKHRLSAFVDTDLRTVLGHLGIQSLILAGVYTDGCVESTARHAYFLDYYVVIVDDCCATVSDERHRSTLERCEWDFGVVATSQTIMALWSGRGDRPPSRPTEDRARSDVPPAAGPAGG